MSPSILKCVGMAEHQAEYVSAQEGETIVTKLSISRVSLGSN